MLVEDFYNKHELKRWSDLNCVNGSIEYDFMVGDIESSLMDNGTWKFELIVISDGYKFYVFDNLDECIEWLFDCDEDMILYFHNLDFDMLFFFMNSKFKSERENMDIIASGNLTIAFKVRNVTFKNSLTLFPMSLKNLVRKFLHVEDLEWFDDKSNVLDLESDKLI